MTTEKILEQDEKMRFMLLNRMKQDCLYYLGYGNRCSKYLWATNEVEQIRIMKILYNSFADDKKPSWLTMEDILQFERQMLHQ